MSGGVPEPEGLFERGGDVGVHLRYLDWRESALGSPQRWPRSLRSIVRVLLGSRFAMWIGWGPELSFLYNDAYCRDTLDTKHPWALGRTAREVWAEIWDEIGPRIDAVLSSGSATWDEALLLFLERSGYREETYHTFSYSPLTDDDGSIAGVLCVVAEETERVIGERRIAALRQLADRLTQARDEAEVLAGTSCLLGETDHDLPFGLVYLFDDDGVARRACASGLPEGHRLGPGVIDPALAGTVWPAAAMSTGDCRSEVVAVVDDGDHARVEAGRTTGTYRPTDFASATARLASMFQSAVEQAGLSLVIDCPPLPAPVYVDGSTWDKIVLNLVSNALKFTFSGTITVTLRPVGQGVELGVSDTGEGISPDDLAQLLTRFDRVRTGRSRTHEGTGIGLALVDELARLHGGSVAVESQLGEGTTVRVQPFGSAQLPGEEVAGEEVAGEEVAGEEVAGEEVAGEEVAGTNSSQRWRPRSCTRPCPGRSRRHETPWAHRRPPPRRR